jgi:hypothetical protein
VVESYIVRFYIAINNAPAMKIRQGTRHVECNSEALDKKILSLLLSSNKNARDTFIGSIASHPISDDMVKLAAPRRRKKMHAISFGETRRTAPEKKNAREARVQRGRARRRGEGEKSELIYQ